MNKLRKKKDKKLMD